MSEIIRAATCLRSVSFLELPLSSSLITILAGLPRLRSVSIYDCTVYMPATLPPNSTILTVDLSLPSWDPTSSLDFLQPLTALRTLSISIDGEVADVPFGRLQPRINPFPTLEHLEITGMDYEEIPGFFAWIEPAIADIKLTHLTLVINGGFTHPELTRLLDTLRDAPLRHLYLDGLYAISPSILEEIGTKLKRLEYLATIYRETRSQFGRKPATWPLSSYEYASPLATFPHLKYFAWNFRIPDFTSYPGDMPFFESGFAEHDNEREGGVDWNLNVSSDWRYTAALFGYNCLTLERVTFLNVDGFQMDFDVVNEPNGTKTVVEDIPKRSVVGEGFNEFGPVASSSSRTEA